MEKKLTPLGTLLRSWRKGRKMSAKEAGALIGISGVQWHRYESGERGMPFSRAVTFSKVTDIPISKLRPDVVKQFSEAAQ